MMSNEKIKAVAKYLTHKDPNTRLQALRKMKAYIERGYNRKLIAQYLIAYMQREKHSQLLEKAQAYLNLCGVRGKLKKTGSKKKTLIIVILFFAMLIGALYLLPEKNLKKNQGKKQEKQVIKKTEQVIQKQLKGNETQRHESSSVALSEAKNLVLSGTRSFPDIKSFNEKIILKFKPYRKQKMTYEVKISQSTNSRGIKMSERKSEFKLVKKVLKKRKEESHVQVTVKNLKGELDPVLIGFPPIKAQPVFYIGNDFSILKIQKKKSKKYGIQKNYVLPLPIYSSEMVGVGDSWGSKHSSKAFSINSEYKLEGRLKVGRKNCLKILFHSASKSVADNSTFKVLRKGIFVVEEKTGVPVYLVLKTFSQSKLKGTGFPIGNEVQVEEILK